MTQTIHEMFIKDKLNVCFNPSISPVNFLFMGRSIKTADKIAAFKRVEQVLEEKGISVADFQKTLDIDSQNWNNWKNRGLPSAQLIKIAGVLGLYSDWLATNEGKKYKPSVPSRLDNNIELGPDIKGWVPLISWVQAGAWCEAIEGVTEGAAEDGLPCPAPHSQRTYALRVRGDSMTAPYGSGQSFVEGTVIYIDPEAELSSGKKVIAKLLDSNEVTFKVYREDGGKKWLIPLNPMYDKIELVDGMHICGVVIYAGFAV